MAFAWGGREESGWSAQRGPVAFSAVLSGAKGGVGGDVLWAEVSSHLAVCSLHGDATFGREGPALSPIWH
eukprot:367472-Rhodomonas_salina.2